MEDRSRRWSGMASPPPPPSHSSCTPVDVYRMPPRATFFATNRPPWISQLAEANFYTPCVEDRVCTTCGGAAFCGHCCADHHRGHDTAPAPAPAENGHAAVEEYRRDAFCTACRVAFSSDLCPHHKFECAVGEDHVIIPIVEHLSWYCARCIGVERWFPVIFDGVQTFRDEDDNFLVPLFWKGPPIPETPSWFSSLICQDFCLTCATDRVCNTCDGARFCDHCCGKHHQGHDTAAATDANDKEPPAAAHRRDSFCIPCRVAFCSDLCAHHHAEGHEVIPIDLHKDCWYCARCTGTEPWFLGAVCGATTYKDEHGNVLLPLHLNRPKPNIPMPAFMLQDDEEDCPWWMRKLVAANFDKTCARDRVCKTCGGVPFCDHCCGEHHGDHHTASARPARRMNGLAVSKEAHRRDSFCIDCGVGFCSNLCAHHAGHEVIPIDAYGDRHFVRSTGSETWFIPSTFDGIEIFEDKDGNLMVPLERKRSILPEPGLRYRYDTTPPIAPHQMDEAMEVSVGN